MYQWASEFIRRPAGSRVGQDGREPRPVLSFRKAQMIAFNSLKQCGFGNQLFQYAFLRTTAKRLGTKFYFPPWNGDKFFCLNDQEERTAQPANLPRAYREPLGDCGFHPAALQIADGTDVWGYFQSERYYPDKDRVRKWYTFSDEMAQIRAKYADIDFANSVSLSLRIGDDYNQLRDRYPLYPLKFYRDALRLVPHKRCILVFSDRPERARSFFRDLNQKQVHLIEGNCDVEDLFLLSQCHDNIITNSSFAWWGAWLNRSEDKTVIMPKEWFRTGGDRAISGIVCENWIAIRALNPVFEHKVVWSLRQRGLQ
jgi:hypothetical protein